MDAMDLAIKLIAQAIGRDRTQIAESDCLGSIPEWDSLAQIEIAELVEQHLGQRLPDRSIECLTSVRDVAAFIKERTRDGH